MTQIRKKMTEMGKEMVRLQRDLSKKPLEDPPSARSLQKAFGGSAFSEISPKSLWRIRLQRDLSKDFFGGHR